MEVNFVKKLGVIAVCLLLVAACSSGPSQEQVGSSSSEQTGSTEDGGEEGLDLDYLLLVDFTLSSSGVVKEQASVLFRGPLQLNPDRTLSVRGQGELEGKFRCVNNDRGSDQKFLGPGTVTGSFNFNVQGILLTEDEFYAYSDADAAEAIPAVPLTESEGEPRSVMTAIPLTEDKDQWALLYFPDGYAPPAVTVEGLDVSKCFPTDRRPTSPMWAVGLSGFLKGDGGEAFNQFVGLPLIPGGPRMLDSLQPELVHAAFLCLARPGQTCEF